MKSYQAFWDERWEGGYESCDGTDTHGPRAREYHRLVKQAINYTDCKTMLDVGCGSCNQWLKCPVAKENFYGVDISQDALDMAKIKWPEAQFYCLDVTKPGVWPFWDQLPEADLITCSDMLNHITPKHFKGVMNHIFKKAKKAIIIRMWTNLGLDGAGGNHWSHEAPEPDGFIRVLLRGPEADSPWSIWAYRRKHESD